MTLKMTINNPNFWAKCLTVSVNRGTILLTINDGSRINLLGGFQMPKTLTAKDFVYGDYNFTEMNSEELDVLLERIVPGYDAQELSVFGKRKKAYQTCKRHEITNEAGVVAFVEKQAQKKLDEVPANFRELNRATLEDLHTRAGMRTDFEKYDDPAENWKLAKALARKCEKENWTIDQVRVREPETSAGRGLPIKWDAETEIPTVEPDGVSEAAAAILNLLRETYEKVTVGRNVSKRPAAMAIIHDLKDARISIALPEEYANSNDNST